MAAHSPTCAVLAIVRAESGRVLLARRSGNPDSGKWGFPGGKIHFGESTMAAAVRELREETNVAADPYAVVDTIDVIDTENTLAQYHYILIGILMHWRTGLGVPGDDVSEVGWFTPGMLPETRSVGVDRVIHKVQEAFHAAP